MKLSVLIPTKNEAAVLPKTLQALKDQSFGPFEIIVADAGSTDETRAIAESFGVLVVEGGMPGPGRNRAAKVASGEILLFLDADTVIPTPHFLRDAVTEFELRQLDMAAVRLHPETDSKIDIALHDVYNAFLTLMEHTHPHGAGCCLFVRASAFIAAKGFDEEIVLAEDHDLIQRLHRDGYTYGILDCEPVITSNRRLDQDGRLLIAARYAYSEYQLLRGRRMTSIPFDYEMGGREKKD